MSVKIIASISSTSDKIDFVKQEALKLIEPTRKESGCIEYQLFENKDDSNNIIFVETWESEEALYEHSQSEHFKIFVQSIGKIATVSLTKASFVA